MEKRKRTSRFLKNRMWKARFSSRLKGKAEEVCQDYMNGMIEREIRIHVGNGPKVKTS